MPKAPNTIAIIGGGIVGLATGLELTRRFPGIALSIIEKEAAVARHQTSHNSGVIHSGIYYKPGSLKALLCVEGAKAMINFCQQNEIPYEICGKVIVATSDDELPRLKELYLRGQGNGLEGLRMLHAGEIREIEPHAAGIQGIHVPSTGIVDYSRVAQKYAELITAAGGTIRLSHEVTGLKRNGSSTIVETTQGPVEADLVINCAGLHSDRISRLANAKLDLAIIPFRGEYYDLAPEKHHYVKGLIYPVPDPRFPFLGVHFTRRIGGGVEAGPNAVLALKREGYSKTSFRPRDLFESVTFPGFWIMAAKYWRTSVGEYNRSWSKAAFVRALQRLMPELTGDDLVPGGSGVRAQALDIDGKLVDDFRFAYTDGIVHVCNVPSPAATASLAIGRHIVDTIVSTYAID
ncbi:L-2-hydroxyglutarate oxidase [Acidobacterium sp. S8]|uniref:L-2-hydroxyglutarate oxidase n=1 Tax=Acidobacterium sp. S8 TaxID=1641854 RepID=UPI00131B0EF2|nr:L-2-hydroxyglutarate oxidase [Acidobacterium sp. S8]